ncbi:hypothetical protein D3C76_1475630 [compost metagenome]
MPIGHSGVGPVKAQLEAPLLQVIECDQQPMLGGCDGRQRGVRIRWVEWVGLTPGLPCIFSAGRQHAVVGVTGVTQHGDTALPIQWNHCGLQ